MPQLLNVLRGDMSFVGPRPERPELAAKLAERLPIYDERHNVRPGITGWAQFIWPNSDAYSRVSLDLFYVENMLSVLAYIAMLVLTAGAVFFDIHKKRPSTERQRERAKLHRWVPPRTTEGLGRSSRADDAILQHFKKVRATGERDDLDENS